MILDKLGITAIRMELPFKLNHVNCFLAEGNNGWTIMDTGLHNDYTIQRWNTFIGQKEISRLLITHYHPDHYGYAGGLQQKTGAEVWMTKTDAAAGETMWTEGFNNELDDMYTLAGVPDDISKKLQQDTADFTPLVTPYPKVNHYVEEGEKVHFGNDEYEVFFTPGHSDGLITLYNEKESVLLSTDHILPKITPNISYWFYGNDNPLALYFDSLQKIKALDVEHVIPSHGKPFRGANERISQIMQHHEERLSFLLNVLKEPHNVYETSLKLFNKELSIHETRFSVGETLAHLEYLRNKQECRRETHQGEWIYYTT
ncbi:MBL fold metallo-hydrolase [Bacillus piscicola]|uniref:MBL fold metallo-hydrolase n=1 Tax=Bacillus piscicola TaxID=1632684 RepID=UPI0023DDE5C9|nr:MBL fold metallo-hydrolase [Bacillus piscicola]